MAEFFYDVIRPVLHTAAKLQLEPQLKLKLVSGFQCPKRLSSNPTETHLDMYLIGLLDTDISGGQRLINVMSESSNWPNKEISLYLSQEWKKYVAAYGAEGSMKDRKKRKFAQRSAQLQFKGDSSLVQPPLF